MKKWFIYIIQCGDGSFYTGITSDPKRRFAEHKQGKGGFYTRKKKAKDLLYIEEFLAKKKALQREKQIKGWTRVKKLKLITGELKPA